MDTTVAWYTVLFGVSALLWVYWFIRLCLWWERTSIELEKTRPPRPVIVKKCTKFKAFCMCDRCIAYSTGQYKRLSELMNEDK